MGYWDAVHALAAALLHPAPVAVEHKWGCDVDRAQQYGEPIDPQCTCGAVEVPPRGQVKIDPQVQKARLWENPIFICPRPADYTPKGTK